MIYHASSTPMIFNDTSKKNKTPCLRFWIQPSQMPPLWSAFLAIPIINQKYQKTTECPKNICPAIQSFCFQGKNIRLKHKIVSRLNNILPCRQSIEDVLVLLLGEIELLLHAREVETVDFSPERVVGLLCFRRI